MAVIRLCSQRFAQGHGDFTAQFCGGGETSLQGIFFNPNIPTYPVFDDPVEVLEVKYDAFLPDVIACLLQTENIRQQAFSKYGACRRFG